MNGNEKILALAGKEWNMAADARMLGVWIYINNPKRSTNEDLNLTVGGTIILNVEALRKLGGKLLTVKIKVMDADAFSDDLLYTDETFQIGVHDTNPICFHTGVIVPHQTLNDSEPFWENTAEVYCRVSASSPGGVVQTNAANSQTEDVAIDWNWPTRICGFGINLFSFWINIPWYALIAVDSFAIISSVTVDYPLIALGKEHPQKFLKFCAILRYPAIEQRSISMIDSFSRI